MTVEQIIEQMDKNIELLNDSVEYALTLPKSEVKEKYGSIKTYNECVSMERGALTSMITFRQWIVNNTNQEGPYWCKYPDENGNKIPMKKVKGSRVMSKEEVEELNKIKLPF